jgi:hypothetical protein
MSVTIYKLPDVTGITHTLLTGGTLATGTTYYYRIVQHQQRYGPDSTSYDGGRVDYTSDPSIEYSFTTNSAQTSVQIDWDPPVSGSYYYNVYTKI